MRKDTAEQTLTASTGEPSSPLPPAPPAAVCHEQQGAASAGLAAGKLAGLGSLMAATLAACGGGGDAGDGPLTPAPGVPSAPGTPGQPIPSPSPAPGPAPSPSPTPAPGPAPGPAPAPNPAPGPASSPITDAEAARFLLQAQMSVSPAEIKAVQQKGYSAWLDEQMNMPISTSGWNVVEGYRIPYSQRFNTTPADFMAWSQLITAPDGLRKRLALAWSEIFVVDIAGANSTWCGHTMAAYWDMLNAYVFGNYRQFLEALTLNPAMGSYLNTKGNRKANPRTGRVPDENYAREIMQLFSIGLQELNQDGTLRNGGAETYSMSDVSNLARVFTGYDFSQPYSVYDRNPQALREPMKFTASQHSTEDVTFLGLHIPGSTDGSNGPARLKAALDHIAAHPNVGPYIGRQLIQRLVTSNPSPAYVGRVAAAFNNDGNGQRGNMAAVTKAVLLDPEAREHPSLKSPTWGKLREPMLRLVQWARTFSAKSSDGRWVGIYNLSEPSTGLNQSPLRSPSVFNFFRPGYVPVGTALAPLGHTAPEFQITDENSVAGYINFMTARIQNGIRSNTFYGTGTTTPAPSAIMPDYTRELALADDAAALVAHLNLMLTANQLSASTIATIRDAIATIKTDTEEKRKRRVHAAILLVMACPEYLVQK